MTAQYRMAFAGDVAQGRISLTAEAYDPNLQLLARQSAQRSVVGQGGAAQPSSAPPTALPTDAATVDPDEEPTVDPDEESDLADDAGYAGGAEETPAAGAAGNQVSQTGTGIGLTEAAFLLGGLLLFLGVGLLLRLRQLTREPDPATAAAGAPAAGSPAAAGPFGRWERQPGRRSQWRTVPRDTPHP
ncbi:hypothetical protein Jiend_10850 [Micromonospora endophytica]|uniref:hypothetical protein n=1 Tax=Micromonospora endophytica TaxID=515350 RepID=UPI001C323EE5|nr:hypothetical protein [Micromonospora endophytica]BCJ57663.1 hypothetical protein Jiend_10850 [Micromonospora endophytica]